jgi:hypothetical protein
LPIKNFFVDIFGYFFSLKFGSLNQRRHDNLHNDIHHDDITKLALKTLDNKGGEADKVENPR